MTAPPATDDEAAVICQHLAPWRLYDFTVDPAAAVRAEGSHGGAGGGWITDSTRRGIRYEYATGYQQPPIRSGLIPWARVTELVRAAAPADVLAALGDAIEQKQALDFLSTRDMWAAQRNEPSLIPDKEAHRREAHRLHWLIYNLGDLIKDRIRNPLPVGQLSLLDLIGPTR